MSRDEPSPESRDHILATAFSEVRFELAAGSAKGTKRHKPSQTGDPGHSGRRSSNGCDASCPPTPSPVMIGSGFCSGRPCATKRNGHGTTGRRDGGATKIFCFRLLDSRLRWGHTIVDATWSCTVGDEADAVRLQPRPAQAAPRRQHQRLAGRLDRRRHEGGRRGFRHSPSLA